jgi:outer membrane lipoprotein-sorting protein
MIAAMNRRTLLSALAAAGLAPAAASAQTTDLPLAQTAAAASAALNAVRRQQGRFVQINPSGRETAGTYWLSRPGKVRFEYDAPSPLLVVSDGSTLIVRDRDLKTTDRAALRTTPLFFILKDKIDIARDARPIRAQRRDGLTLLSLRDRAGQAEGELTLGFDSATMALRQWIILDGQGRFTTVRLQTTQTPASLDPKLFVLREAILGPRRS